MPNISEECASLFIHAFVVLNSYPIKGAYARVMYGPTGWIGATIYALMKSIFQLQVWVRCCDYIRQLKASLYYWLLKCSASFQHEKTILLDFLKSVISYVLYFFKTTLFCKMTIVLGGRAWFYATIISHTCWFRLTKWTTHQGQSCS